MERKTADLKDTDNKCVCGDAAFAEPVEQELQPDTERAASPACDAAEQNQSLKRRSLGVAMEVHQKRQALPEHGAAERDDEQHDADHGVISQDQRNAHAAVANQARARQTPGCGDTMMRYHDGNADARAHELGAHDAEYAACDSPIFADQQMCAEPIDAQERLPLCLNRQQIAEARAAAVERRTVACMNQVSIGTHGSSCATQGTCRDRIDCETHPFPSGNYDASFGNLNTAPLQDVNMAGAYNDDEHHLRTHSNNSRGGAGSPRIHDMEMHEAECAGIDLINSFSGPNDFACMSQMANPVCMNQLEDTAILDTMLGPSRSVEESMINMMGGAMEIQGELDAVPSLEIRRLSNGSVNLASDCGDVKRQIVVDENLTNTILKDLICSICLEYFYFPVTLCCGHTFCRYCIGHLRLAGKLCPLCRKEVGRPPNVNTIMWNLVKALKIRKRPPLPPEPRDCSFEEEKAWWDEHCLKPFMSLPLFLRIMFGDIVQTPPFFDDVCTCVVDYFDRHGSWSKAKWVFTLEDSRVLRRLVGFDSDDMDATSTRLHLWVENYLSTNPHLCCTLEEPFLFVFKVYSDINHKIDGISFNAMNIHHRLPWDAGRHQKSLLHLPHSSVSLSHLVFVPCGQGQVGLLDCGSTIGTMIKLQGQRTLQDGDRIHVGDKHEVDVILSTEQPDGSYGNFMWDTQRKEVVDITMPDAANSDPAFLEPIDYPLKLRIFADAQEERGVWTSPKGIILGRGPQTQSAFKKLSITTQNGYISREHCLIYYDGGRPTGQRWILRDMSTLGTFLKVKPFQQPVPIEPGFIFKVGQCKVEVCSANEGIHRRASNSPAALILSQLIHNHFSNVGVSLPPAQADAANVPQQAGQQPEE